MISGLFQNVIYKMYLEIILNICLKKDLVLNYIQWLIFHKTKPNQIFPKGIRPKVN